MLLPFLSGGYPFDLLALVLLLLGFAFGWNNSSLTTGNLSNLINYHTALVLTLAGMSIGLIVEGSKMSSTVFGNLIVSRQASPIVILAGIVTSLAILFTLNMIQIPVSLSNCVVGAFVGAAVAAGFRISIGFLSEVVASWIIAPLLGTLLAIAIYNVLTRATKRLSLLTLSWVNRLLLLITVFYVSYALGANNIGLIFSLYFATQGQVAKSFSFVLGILIFVSVATGTILFGKSIAKAVGEKIVGLSQIKTLSAMLAAAMVTWSYTQFSIPLSLTQVIISGMIGASSAIAPSIVNRAYFFSIVRSWSLTTVVCGVLGFGVGYLFLHFG